MKDLWKRTNQRLRVSMMAVGAIATFGLVISGIWAHDPEPGDFPPGVSEFTEDACTTLEGISKDPVNCGTLSPLIPEVVNSVHSAQMFKTVCEDVDDDSDEVDCEKKPFLVKHFRFTNWFRDDIANPEIIDALTEADDPLAAAFLSTVRSIFGPDFTVDLPTDPDGPPGNVTNAFGDPSNNFNHSLRESFKWLAYEGWRIVQGLSQTVPTRFESQQEGPLAELTTFMDLTHPDVFRTIPNPDGSPKLSDAELTNADFDAVSAAYMGVGRSAGLVWNTYCNGGAMTLGGKLVLFGGHKGNSHNAPYKYNVFDPETMTWEPRTPPCSWDLWEGANATWNGDAANPVPSGSFPDPYHEQFFQARVALWEEATGGDYGNRTGDFSHDLLYFDGCNPHDVEFTDDRTGLPIDFSAGAPLDPNAAMPINPPGGSPATPVDPSDGKYARWYPTLITLPNGLILTISGDDQNESVAPKPGGTTGETGASDAAFRATRVVLVTPEVYNPLENGRTILGVPPGRTLALECARKVFPLYPNAWIHSTGVDDEDWVVVVAAGRDPNDLDASGNPIGAFASRDPKFTGPYNGNTHTFDVQAALRDPNCSDSVNDADVRHWSLLAVSAVSHPNYFGAGDRTDLDEDGNIVSHRIMAFGGRISGASTNVATLEMMDLAAAVPQWTVQQPMVQAARFTSATTLADGTFLLGNGANFQIPSGPGAFERRNTLPFQRFFPDTGELRSQVKTKVPRHIHATQHLLQSGEVYNSGHDRITHVQPGDPVAPRGDPDLGVDQGQIYTPGYLHTGNPRPEITEWPRTIEYKREYELEIAGVDASDISFVSLVRIGYMTHEYSTDQKIVIIPPKEAEEDELEFSAPRLPASAIAGNYWLFVVSNDGVPSEGKAVVVAFEDDDD